MDDEIESFTQFGLSDSLTEVVESVGYETPTPIQVKTIPLLLAGKDVIGQAQTGTGKTAAFALPILEKLDIDRRAVQVLVLTPTRELALQVAEAFHTYSKRMGGVRVLPVYGGQSIQAQLTRLKSGVQIVVGTPGRIMDHLRRSSLNFDALKMVVLDEADEMLRMGFLEDVEWILSQAPEGLQKALFSATMPAEIRRIAARYLQEPVTVEIEHKTLTVPTVEQRYIIVAESKKVDALAQFLESHSEPGEAVLIFARTKVSTVDLAEKLQARGVEAEAMNGDLNQFQRERVIRRLRAGELEVVVATDVAARGLDVERIGLVVNYDVPYDVESYVHRIGRTGRAGRAGKSLLFITPRQKRMLRDIEGYTGQRIEPAKVPTQADIAARRIALFKESLVKILEEDDLEFYLELVEDLSEESGRDIAEIAAAAVRMARADRPLEVIIEPASVDAAPAEEGMVRLYMDAGRMSGVRPSDIVGAIANEAGIPGNAIGAIDIFDRFSFVDVPAQYIQQVLESMEGATIRSRDAKIRVATPKDRELARSRERSKARGKKFYPKKRKRFDK